MEVHEERPVNYPTAAVLHVSGSVDGSNFQQLINKAQDEYAKGVRQMVLEISQVEYMSSSGLVALNAITKLLHGERPPNTENGWAVLKTLDDARAPVGKAQLA